MMIWIVLAALILVSLVAIAKWRTALVKAATRRNLWQEGAEVSAPILSIRSKRFAPKRVWFAFVPGVVVLIALSSWFPFIYAVAFSVLITIICWQLIDIWSTRKIYLIEEQLADMMDLMTSGLKAGSGPVAAMDSALLEIGKPIGPVMADVMGRLKLGDSPTKVFGQLSQETDLETFRIFGASMAVHWETGGRLVPLLTTIGKMIRDRIEVMRNARLQSAQGKFSAIIFVLVTYVLAYAVWRYDPFVMSSFVASVVGSSMMAFLIVLQAIGMLWIQRMTKLRY